MPDLVVDLEGLSAFAANLEQIRARLAQARDQLRGHDDVLGHDQVADELDRFEDRWRDGREKIQSNCEALGSMVTQSVTGFRQADTDLANSLQVAEAS